MNIKQYALAIILILGLLLTGCAPGQPFGPTRTPTPTSTPTATSTPLPTPTSALAVPAGKYSCTIVVSIQSKPDMVILGITITPDHTIGDWSLFDFATRTVSFGTGAPMNGNDVQFNNNVIVNGMTIPYKINGTFLSPMKLSGDYSIDYGSYGVSADKFDCDLVIPATPTPKP